MKIMVNIPSGMVNAMKEKAGDDSLQAYLISLAKKDVTTIQYTLEKTNVRRGDKESVCTDEIHS
jgi:hypothetical protein